MTTSNDTIPLVGKYTRFDRRARLVQDRAAPELDLAQVGLYRSKLVRRQAGEQMIPPYNRLHQRRRSQSKSMAARRAI
jgi:hypothetical protein